MPIADVIDRISITKLKIDRANESDLKKELENLYQVLDLRIEQLKRSGSFFDLKKEWIDRLYEINSKIWDLEADIRKGREGELGLEEVGRRALLIRDLNKQRVEIKDAITEKITSISGSKDIRINGFKENKLDHASE